MKFFLDTEFIEGFRKPFPWLPTIGSFNKAHHRIELISIGIVAEDGREYSAVSSEFNPGHANDWVLENVLSPMLDRYMETLSGDEYYFALETMPQGIFDQVRWLQHRVGKSKRVIAQEIREFCTAVDFVPGPGHTIEWSANGGEPQRGAYRFSNPEFYAYYADYDWVALCSLFGTMEDLPGSFPMYCRDLKQTKDEVIRASIAVNLLDKFPIDTQEERFRKQSGYPQQTDEHDALEDARWNLQLYEHLQICQSRVDRELRKLITYTGRRRDGNTTRMADLYVQQLFNTGQVEVRDHPINGESATALNSKHLFRTILQRLEREHFRYNLHDHVDIDAAKCTITKKALKPAPSDTQ